MNIRKAEVNDCDQILDLLVNIGWFTEYLGTQKDITKRKIIEHISLCIQDNSHSLYVAEDSKEILGYISVHWLPYLFLNGPEGYISELFVKNSARGKGIGGKLLEFIKVEAKERGCSRLSLLNGRNRESYDRKYYDKQGFTERAQLVNFIYKLK
jgi:N-acetylglutamate synthase-like GNAT family acetyltransferase